MNDIAFWLDGIILVSVNEEKSTINIREYGAVVFESSWDRGGRFHFLSHHPGYAPEQAPLPVSSERRDSIVGAHAYYRSRKNYALRFDQSKRISKVQLLDGPFRNARTQSFLFFFLLSMKKPRIFIRMTCHVNVRELPSVAGAAILKRGNT